jgi:hypothetical protein
MEGKINQGGKWLKKIALTSILTLAVVAGAGWAAKPQVKPATKTAEPQAISMQSIGTFEEAKPSAKVSIFVSPEELESASFTIKSAKSLSGVTVKLAGDLASPKSKIAANLVSISLVEGNRLTSPKPVNLQPGKTKRYWMTFNVPVNTVAGAYTGAVVAVAGGKAVGKIPVEVNVLGIRLIGSSKQYGVLLPNQTEAGSNYKSLLGSIKAIGFSMTSTAAPVEQLDDAFAAIKEAKLGSATTPVTYMPAKVTESCLQGALSQASSAKVSKLLCTCAFEPRTRQEIQTAADAIEVARNARVKTLAVIDDPNAFSQLADSLEMIDCHVNLPYAQGLLSGEKPAPKRHEWWYWDITTSSKDNRLYAGLLLWKSGLYGAFPTLPAGSESVVGTIQWQALREGVDDTRYITSMMKVLREAKDLKKGKDLTDEAEAYLAAVLNKPLKNMSDADCQAIRMKLAQYTLKIQEVAKQAAP